MVDRIYNKLKTITNNTVLVWRDVRGIAPDSVANKIDSAMIDWIYELTCTLEIWINKGKNMSMGELILARTNIGAVTESWLKLFYCAYYEDYLLNPKTRKGVVVEPEKLKFVDMINYSVGILWPDVNSELHTWVDSVRDKRNAIHIFEYKDIGTAEQFLDDIKKLYEFVQEITDRLPPLEDYLDELPLGYINTTMW